MSTFPLTSANAIIAAGRAIYLPPLLLWAFSFVIGVALSLGGASLWLTLLAVLAATLCSAVSLAGAHAIARNRAANMILVLLAPTLLAVGFWRAESTKFELDSLAVTDLGEQTVRIEGVIIEDPQFDARGMNLTILVNGLRLGDERRETRDVVRLSVSESEAVRTGDRISARASLEGTADANDDFLAWLASRRVAATGRALPGSVTVLEQGQLSWRRQAATDARSALNRSLRNSLPPPYSGIAQGMTTGRRDAIDSDLRTTLNDTSLSHLVVISGSNLTLLTAIVMSACSWLLGRRSAAALAIVAALAYGTLVGDDPPVQRAMWMAIVFAGSHLIGRGASALDAAIATAGFMIGLKPQILLDLSFQLTIAGTLGIVILMPSLSHEFLSGSGGVGSIIRDVALITMVASLATMPLIALHFERASLIGIAANLLAAPLFAWMLIGAATTALVGLVSESSAVTISWALAWLPLRWLVIVAETTVRLPGAGDIVRGFTHVHLLIIYTAILIATVRPHRERIRRWYRAPSRHADSRLYSLRAVMGRLSPHAQSQLAAACLTGIVVAAAAAIWLFAWSPGPERLQVHFIDVGQGDAALIVTPERRSVLIDTGGRPDDILSALRSHLPESASAIDALVISHPQSDHVEALWAIRDFYDIKQVYVSARVRDTSVGRRAVNLLTRTAVPITIVHAGDQIVVPGPTPLYLDVLWPPVGGLPEAYLSDPNATSLVLRARYGETAFLFSGDINAAQELDLVRFPCPGSAHACEIRADVLKVAHQGSRFSSTSLFLEMVRPTIAVLSASADNPHGHPHESVVASLRRIGANSLLTADRGDISVASDGRSISVATER